MYYHRDYYLNSGAQQAFISMPQLSFPQELWDAAGIEMPVQCVADWYNDAFLIKANEEYINVSDHRMSMV